MWRRNWRPLSRPGPREPGMPFDYTTYYEKEDGFRCSGGCWRSRTMNIPGPADGDQARHQPPWRQAPCGGRAAKGQHRSRLFMCWNGLYWPPGKNFNPPESIWARDIMPTLTLTYQHGSSQTLLITPIMRFGRCAASLLAVARKYARDLKAEFPEARIEESA